MKSIALASVAFLSFLAFAPRAGAQPQVPGGKRPPLSPYLNLARSGVPPAINYYGLVRPQLDFRSSLQILQGQVTGLEQQVTAESEYTTESGQTGQRAQFMSHTRYFLNAFTVNPATRGPGTTPTQATAASPRRFGRTGPRR